MFFTLQSMCQHCWFYGACSWGETFMLCSKDSCIQQVLTWNNYSFLHLSLRGKTACSVFGCIALLASWQMFLDVPWYSWWSGVEILGEFGFVVLLTWLPTSRMGDHNSALWSAVWINLMLQLHTYSRIQLM